MTEGRDQPPETPVEYFERVKDDQVEALWLLGHTFPDQMENLARLLDELAELIDDMATADIVEERLRRGGERIPAEVMLREFVAEGLLAEEDVAHILNRAPLPPPEPE